MDKRKILFAFIISCTLLVCPSVRADESDLFTTVAPDALILLDLSGSMDYPPPGEFLYIAGSDLIPELKHETKIAASIGQLAAILLGIAVMASLLFIG